MQEVRRSRLGGRQRGPLLEEIKARATYCVSSVSGDNGPRLLCLGCNSDLTEDPVIYRAPSQIYEEGGVCAKCYLESDNPESGIVVFGVSADHRDPEKRCARLFKAARVLLKDRQAGEDEIFPTLRLASAMWAPRFRLQHWRVKMVRVVGEVPILRRRAFTAYASRSILPSASDAILAIHVVVHPSRRKTTADDVAEAYGKVLEREDLPWGYSGGRVSHLFYGSEPLELVVEENDQFKIDPAPRSWPSPAIVGGYAEAVIEEAGEGLVLRKHGGELSPDNLILAVVARTLADAVPRRGNKINRKEVYRLLNSHVLCAAWWRKSLDDGNPGDVRALWRNVKKVGRMDRLYGMDGPMSVSQPV